LRLCSGARSGGASLAWRQWVCCIRGCTFRGRHSRICRIHRDEFGIDSGKAYGFNMEVTLRIQVEAIIAN
jgi:hypothetical protein